jgi:hypothetical protein
MFGAEAGAGARAEIFGKLKPEPGPPKNGPAPQHWAEQRKKNRLKQFTDVLAFYTNCRCKIIEENGKSVERKLFFNEKNIPPKS